MAYGGGSCMQFIGKPGMGKDTLIHQIADQCRNKKMLFFSTKPSTIRGKKFMDFKEFKKEALVIDKWFMLQGIADTTDVAKVRELMQHKAFTLTNPNRARSLTFSFCNANPSRFHAADGSGYALWAELVIELNKINPQVAARLARSLDRWKKYPLHLQEHMKLALEKVAATKKLSKDVAEVVGKALAA